MEIKGEDIIAFYLFFQFMNIIILSLMFLNSSSLPLLLALSSLWGFIFTVKRYTKLRTGFIPLFALSSLAVLGYFSCFLSIFKQINFFLMLFGNVLLLWEVFLNGKALLTKKLKLKTYLLSQKTILFFILSSMVLVFYVSGASLFGWDEFFWGQFAKFIHEYGHFWHLGDAVLSSHAIYPPMVAISQNIFMPFGVFNEEAMFFANLLPIICVLTYVFDSLVQKITKKSFLQFVITTSLIYWAYFYFCFFNFKLSFATADHAMAMIFTTILLFLYENRNSQAPFSFLLPTLFFLTLYKTTGLLLAASSIAILLLPKFIRTFQEKKKILIKNNFFLIIIFSFIICLAYFSWDKYVQTAYNLSSEPTKQKVSVLKKVQLNKNFYLQVTTNFTNALFNKSLNYRMGVTRRFPQLSSLVFWFACVIFLQFIVVISSKKKPKKQEFYIFFLLLNICFILWILFHLCIWLFVFSEYEGLALASYERYLNTFLVAVFIFSIYLLSKKSLKSKKVFIFLMMASLFLNLNFCITKKSVFIGPRFFRESNRDSQAVLAEKVKKVLNESSAKIWFVSQKSNGYEAMIFRYEMSPKYSVQAGGWSLGIKYYPEDIWTVNLSAAGFQDSLLGKDDASNILYDYIVLGKVDQQFQEQYGMIFSEKTSSETLWQLQENNGSLLATPVPL